MLPDIPEDIQNAGLLVKKLSNKPVLTRIEKENLQQAKLKVAFWACSIENIAPSRENLTYVLGADSKEIMEAFDKAMKERSGRSEKYNEKTNKDFWDGAQKK